MRLRSLLLAVMLGAAVVIGAAAAPNAKADAPEGRFLVQCLGPVKTAPEDPIVGGSSHNHEFYGNRTISLSSTYNSMRAGSTACGSPAHTGDEPGDTASYWHPTLYVSGQRLPVPKSTFYYTSKGNKPLGSMRSWPANLKIITGNAHATGPQSTKIVYWGCGDGSSVSKVNFVPQCRSGDTGLTIHFIFPDCWNGRDLDSPDHKSHLAHSDSGSCPSSHPVLLPYLIARYQWTRATPNPGDVTLSSGPPHSAHADFWNTWKQSRLDQLVDKCINAGKKCTYADVDAIPQPK